MTLADSAESVLAQNWTGASTVRKSLAEGYPVGLLANRICRWVEGLMMAGA